MEVRTFLTTPSRARTQLVHGGHLIGITLINLSLLTDAGGRGLVWAALAVTAVLLGASALILSVDANGAVTNPVSLVAGRPIALSSRGRERISLDRITPEQRRTMRLVLAVAVMGMLFLAVMVAAIFVLTLG
jgi:hypothetical protein